MEYFEDKFCDIETNQAAMELSPAQAPTATQVWPAPGKGADWSQIQEKKKKSPGAGELPGAGDETTGGAAVIGSFIYWRGDCW